MFVRPHVALTTAMDTCQGDYHKFCFCGDVLGIEECREEIITICGCQRISHSAVCCCFSVFQRDVKKKWKCFGVECGGRGRGSKWGATFPLWRNFLLICTYAVPGRQTICLKSVFDIIVRCWLGWTLATKIFSLTIKSVLRMLCILWSPTTKEIDLDD